MDESHGRRRIDRILSPEYLERVDERSVAELRALRDECRAEEEELSFARRVLQGQLDIARTEAARRAGEAGDGALLANLPSILADPPPSEPRETRAVGLHVPAMSGRRVGDPDSPEAALSRLPDLADAEIADLIGRLSEQEQRVSHQRRLVLDHIDRLQDELVRRYRDGALTIDEVVAGTGSAPSDGDPSPSG